MNTDNALARALSEIAINMNHDITEYSEEDKIRAAYALNLCTVSVSQIVDYDDINILEQEYEAILNNLNLEKMPKDQALLNILMHLMDTITFFRIEEGDKQMVEKEYQHKIKNAIWEAVPNFAMLANLANPLNLATTVGISYMNYRRKKADYLFGREKELWALEKTAIEQMNGLQRELFNTSWRLADTYKFPDKYRLTERQIKQYNAILMDSNAMRKFERLESVEDNFVAYPPFWYFKGNAANEIYHDENISISAERREEYKEIAISSFEKFINSEVYGILREDHIVSSCALEYIDLLDASTDKEKIKELLDKAINMSGNANDVLELCMLDYIRIGCLEDGITLLRRLINEGYNTTVNAQILSRLYVVMFNETKNSRYLDDKDTLASRITDCYLFPTPEDDSKEALAKSDEDFIELEREELRKRYGFVLEQFMNEKAIQFENVLKKYESGKYPKMQVEEDIAWFFNQIVIAVSELSCVSKDVQTNLISQLGLGIYSNKELMINENPDSEEEFILADFMDVAYTFFYELSHSIKDYVCGLTDLNHISIADSDLRQFAQREKLIDPDKYIENEMEENGKNRFIDISVFGAPSEEEQIIINTYNQLKECIRSNSSKLVIDEKNETQLIVNIDENRGFYDAYFSRWSIMDKGLRSNTVAVLANDKTNDDILFTISGIRRLTKIGGIGTKTLPYDAVKWGKAGREELILGSDIISTNWPYRNKGVKMDALLHLIQELSKIVRQEEEDDANPLQVLM